MRKRSFALILSLVIISALLPVCSFAEDKDISSGYSVLFVNDNNSQSYTGSDIRPEVVVVDDEFWSEGPSYQHTYEYYISDSNTDAWRKACTLPSGNYVVTYPEDCVNAGEKIITISGKDGYSGTITAAYYINSKEIKFTNTKNADKSVTLTAADPVDLSGADVFFYNEDYHLKSSEFIVSDNSVTISADFLRSYTGTDLDHRVRISTDNFYGIAKVRSYNISKLPGLGNIRKVYNGKQRTLTGSDIGLNDAKLGTEYKVIYAKAKRKEIGTYKFTIKGKGDYVGSQTRYFTIIPQTPARITYARKSGTRAVVKWKKVANCSGYQVQLIRYSKAESDMPDYVIYKSSIVKGRNVLSKTFRNAKKSKYTRVRVRSYKLVSGKKIYSKWKYRSF